MVKIQALRKKHDETNEPVNIGERAVDNLKFIRETMERSAVFTTVPGYGGVFMGVTAIAASYIANDQPSVRNWLIVWLCEAVLAFFIGLFAMWQKSKLANVPLNSPPTKKFAKSFLPPLVCAVVITLGMLRFEHYETLIPVWILLYGAAVICGGAFSVKAVPIMGWCFIAFGAAAFFIPDGYGNWLMASSFGALHIIFGLIIARKYGG
jgi:hypothetical protein